MPPLTGLVLHQWAKVLKNHKILTDIHEDMCRITIFLLQIWDCPSNTGYTNMASPLFGRTPQGAKILLMWEQTMKTNLEQTVWWPGGVHVCRQWHRLWLQWACFLRLYLRSDLAGNFMAETITNRTKCCHVNPGFPKLKRNKKSPFGS